MKYFKTALVSITVLILFSCAKNYNQEMQKSETLFYKGSYKEAARLLLPAVNKESKNQLLYLMECGMMLHSGGDYKNSNQVFQKAVKLYPKIAISVSKQTASLFLNERSTNYRGENFEKVLIHMYSGINFLKLNQIESARVEFKRVNNLLSSFKLKSGKSYDHNILAKYLTAVCYEILGDMDQSFNDWEYAYIEYKRIYELNPRLPYIGQDLMRTAYKLKDNTDLAKWQRRFGRYQYNPAKNGTAMILFHNGQGVIKKSRGKLLADPKMKMAIRIHLNSMSLEQGVTVAGILASLHVAEHPIPKFMKRSNRVHHIDIYENDKLIGRTFVTDDLSSTAFLNMEDKYDTIMTKTAVGIAVKAAASIAAAKAAEKMAEQNDSLGPYAGLIGAVTGAAVGTGFASQIKPDLRCWHTLPEKMQFFKVDFPVGEHNLTLRFIGQNGTVIETRTETLNIEAGKESVVNIRTTY